MEGGKVLIFCVLINVVFVIGLWFDLNVFYEWCVVIFFEVIVLVINFIIEFFYYKVFFFVGFYVVFVSFIWFF